ncbi:hypothetical protein HPG69_000610 [Diceros bicornis minor]|uniref:Phosphodiesterase n=1 Tax=Diceros bicornis minor TaxID=77932 RepID=A0A7J7FJ60_DICBM|nr:hypothetical protein HPG69_000610 [Diceros bicornis minor]
MESPTKEIEEFESNSLKYLQPEQIEKIWLRLRGLNPSAGNFNPGPEEKQAETGDLDGSVWPAVRRAGENNEETGLRECGGTGHCVELVPFQGYRGIREDGRPEDGAAAFHLKPQAVASSAVWMNVRRPKILLNSIQKLDIRTTTYHGTCPWEHWPFRLRSLVKQLERGEASVVDLKKNLEYAATVLESVYIDETRRLLDTEDELSDIQSDAVPSEVRDWLASTFTRQMGMMLRRSEEKPRFKSIVHAVQAGIFVERMYRRTSNMVGLSYPAAVIEALKDVDKWSFDVFSLNEASGDHALKFIFYELLTRYDLISRFKIPISALVSFVEALEVGYSKHKNPYHNLMHAADVTQTVHYLLYKTGVANWLTELEIFAIIFSAAIHDYEHTGTTNNFHIQTRSDPAILYNDRSVLENHHLSAAYRLLQEDEEMNILINLSKDDWR